MNRFHSEAVEHQGTSVHPPAVATTTAREDAAPAYLAVEAEEDLTAFRESHAWDPNIGNEKLDAITGAIKNHDDAAEIALEEELVEDSPYPEVKAAVNPTDSVDIPASTFRAWFLGMLFVTIGSGVNVLFSLREPSISIGSLVAQLCCYPIGVFMAKVLPKRQFSFFGWKWSLNPGPFNKKEHALITIMANVTFSGGPAYSTLTIEAQRGFVS
jgi:hypothetical protein